MHYPNKGFGGGGLVGNNQGSGTINNSYASGSVKIVFML
ncbi:GLUG motif-containing protein [Paenibacillus macquariensis]